MTVHVECPECGESVEPSEIEEKKDEDPPLMVARRQTGFSGDVTSLLEMDAFAYIIEMPCCETKIITVN